MWKLRQDLTGGLTETLMAQSHVGEPSRQPAHCPDCDRLLPARPAVSRTVETLVGAVHLERPYCYCPSCHRGGYPFDEAVGLTPGRHQLDIQKAAAQVVVELPYDTAQTLFGELTGVRMGSERMHTLTNPAAAGLTGLDVAPPRAEIERRIAELAAGRSRRSVQVHLSCAAQALGGLVV